jgi:hypothetical protein
MVAPEPHNSGMSDLQRRKESQSLIWLALIATFFVADLIPTPRVHNHSRFANELHSPLLRWLIAFGIARNSKDLRDSGVRCLGIQ